MRQTVNIVTSVKSAISSYEVHIEVFLTWITIGIIAGGVLLSGCMITEEPGATPLCGFTVDAPPPMPDAPASRSVPLNTAWTRHTIYAGPGTGTNLKGADGVDMRDINGDGLLDLTVGWEQSARTSVHLHPGCAAAKDPWPTTILPGTTSGVEDAVFGDVDKDGKQDVVSAGSSNLRLYIHFNTGPFVTIAAASNAQRFLKSIVVDIDNDGFNDIVAGGYSTGASLDIYSSRTPRDPASWSRKVIGQVGALYSLAAKDMDNDGDLDLILSDRDLVTGKPELRGSRWLANPGNSTGTWTSFSISNLANTRWHYADPMGRLVVDGTGTGTTSAGNTLAIRTSPDGRTWSATAMPVVSNVGQYNAAEYADVDQDGNTDIVLTYAHAVGALSGVVWLRGPTWERGEVSGPDGEKYDNLMMYDVDCDGDLDIVTNEQGRKGDLSVVPLGNVWYENPLL